MTEISRTLVVLGAGGDLTARLLLPGVAQLLASDRGTDLRLLGVGMDAMSDDDWAERVSKSFESSEASGPRIDQTLKTTRYFQADVTDAKDLERVIAACEGEPALYFALPPAITVAACEALADVELPVGTVLALEKPFGTDLVSAERLNKTLLELVPENRIHRVDHFLGKSTVLNILGLRFANRIIEPLLNSREVAKVEIVFDEHLGLENRAGYYDTAGALVDMIQSHLLLVLALVTMEAPPSVYAGDLRDAMATVLRATKVTDGPGSSRRARYTAGEVRGNSLPPYAEEDGVDPARETETLAELTVEVQNWRWAGVPFVLRSGKALASEEKGVIVTFKDVPRLPDGLSGKKGPERLRISLSPDELELDITVNGQGDPFELDQAVMSVTFAAGELGPYGEVLAGILADDPTLSVRADAVEECWRIVTPVLDAWREGKIPLDEYAAGTDGPVEWEKGPR